VSRLAQLYERSRHWSLTRQLVMAAVVILVAAAIVGAIGGGGDSGSSRASSPPLTTTVNPTTTTSAASTTSTTAPPVTASSTPAPTGGGITQLRVAEPSHQGTYDRDLFGGDWIDADGDCQNTRAEALIAETQVPVTFTSTSGCTVATGEWVDPWSGTVNASARALDVDHTVPLANAWRSGAWAWTAQQRVAFANDLDFANHLIAIPLGENRSKGDAGPEAWRPPDHGAWCQYARDWTAIKARQNLTASPAEWSSLLTMASEC
jgi:hypothetical protein